MHVFRFHTNGTIEKVEISNNLKEPLTFYQIEDYHIQKHMCCIESGENDFTFNTYFLMHTDNNLPYNYQRTTLPINQAIQKFFPNSVFVGDMTLIRIDEFGNLTDKDWDYEFLSEYIMSRIDDEEWGHSGNFYLRNEQDR